MIHLFCDSSLVNDRATHSTRRENQRSSSIWKKHRISHQARPGRYFSSVQRSLFSYRSCKGFHPNMSTYNDNPPGPGNRDIAGMDSGEQFKTLPRKYPSPSNPDVYRPTVTVREKSSRISQRRMCPLECVEQISAIAQLPAL
jgi:hypothetical protein